MKNARRALWPVILGIAWASCYAQDNPQTGAHGPSQAVADALRAAAGTDGAFIAAGLVKPGNAKDLAAMIQFGTDEIVVLNLKGAQIKRAFERSVSLYPHPNSSFLQVSGFEVTISRSAQPEQRVKSITVGGAPLQESRTYTVAMPASLGRGGFGYFAIWDKPNIAKTLQGTTVEAALRGKTASPSSPRYSVSP